MRVISEAITDLDEPVLLYEVVSPGGVSHVLLVRYNNFARGGKKPRIVCSDQQTNRRFSLSWTPRIASEPRKHKSGFHK